MFKKSENSYQNILNDSMEEPAYKAESGDKAAAQFASKHAYLFAEKCSELASKEDKRAALFHIKTLADRARNAAYSKESQSRMAVLEEIKGKHENGRISARLIEMNAGSLKRKYQ